jgi:hypothetical protein
MPISLMNWQILEPMVWPLSFILVALFVLHTLREEFRPLVKPLIGGLSQSFATNSTQVAIAIAFGLSASLSAFYDAFSEMASKDLAALSYHQYFAIWSRVLNPFLVAILAYATQNGFVPRTTTIETTVTAKTP